jgi:site-specific DNA-methyltransferase (adenine-specific)
MKLENLRIADLTPDPQNARQHDDKNLKAIMGSLKEFGQRKPIVITEAGVIVAGNGTVEAAKRLGWLDIEVVRVPPDWTDAQVKAFAIADNRTAELANWNQEVLTSQLLELEADGWELAEFGFEALELPNSSETNDEEEALTFETAPQRSSLGDHWRVGKHEIICGNSLEPGITSRFGVEFDAVITDPPYGIGASGWERLGKGRKNNNVGSWDNGKPPISWVLELAPKILIWGGNYFTDELPPTNDWLCWHKKNDGRTFSEFELAWTNFGKQARIISHHWSHEQKLHMTMKPSPVMDWCSSFVPAGSKILDVFAGSGSTLLAAHRANQIGYGVEIDPIYVDVILDRLEKLTGQKAELLPAKAN